MIEYEDAVYIKTENGTWVRCPVDPVVQNREAGTVVAALVAASVVVLIGIVCAVLA